MNKINKINGKESSSSLRQILSKIQQNSDKKIGLYIKNKDGSFKSLKEILNDQLKLNI